MREWNLDDPHWRDRVGDDPEIAFRQAMRLCIDLRDRETFDEQLVHRRVLFLGLVLGHLRGIVGYDCSDLWERD